MATSFAVDIRPLFRDSPDVDSMQGIRARSLVLRGVKARAPEIYARLVGGSIPCDEPWPPDRLGFFRLWMDEGCAP
jgi:hypothetical protein